MTLSWIDEKYLQIAAFYIRVSKPKSARIYLHKILRRPDSPVHDRALRKLRKIGDSGITPKERSH